MTTPTDLNPGEAQARRLEYVYAQLDALLRQPRVAERLRSAPGENEWSALQVVGHMTEMIPYWLNHCRALIDAPVPPQFGRTLDSPERLAAVDPAALRDPEQLLRLLHAEVETAAAAMRQLSPAERLKKGIHNRQGEMTVDDVLEKIVVEHAEEHLAQVQAALTVADLFVGAWELVSGSWTNEDGSLSTDAGAQIKSLKVLAANKFSFVTTARGSFYAAGGGDYRVENGTYTEIPALASHPGMVGKRYTFQYQLDGDTWTNSRTENGVRVELEVWSRIR